MAETSTEATQANVQTTAAVTAVHGPYEDLAIKGLDVLEKIIDSQPKDIQAQLWNMWLQDLQSWRQFWKDIGAKIP